MLSAEVQKWIQVNHEPLFRLVLKAESNESETGERIRSACKTWSYIEGVLQKALGEVRPFFNDYCIACIHILKQEKLDLLNDTIPEESVQQKELREQEQLHMALQAMEAVVLRFFSLNTGKENIDVKSTDFALHKETSGDLVYDFALTNLKMDSYDVLMANVSDDWESFYQGIQFPKDFFHDMTEFIARRWCVRIRRILYRYYCVLKTHSSGKNDIKYLKGETISGNPRISKCRIDGNYRMLWYLSPPKIITLLDVIRHDEQKNFKNHIFPFSESRISGFVYWQVKDFLRRIDWFNAQPSMRKTKRELEACLMDKSHFNYDAHQLNIIKQSNRVIYQDICNISVVGNAGSGKSVIGSNWLQGRIKRHEPCIYLTMSRNLTERMRNEYLDETKRQETEITWYLTAKDEQNAIITFQDTFSFLNICSRRNKNLPCRFMNPQESFEFFKKVCSTITHGWSCLATGRRWQSGILLAWRIIHGVIKGCIDTKRNIDFSQEPISVGKSLSVQEFLARKPEQHKELPYDRRTLRFLFSVVLNVYENALHKEKLGDDNDLARFILLHTFPLKNQWQSAFIDECQDLTEIQLLALNYCLKNCKRKLFSSDRCQIIQPTTFQPGRMIRDANSLYNKETEGKIELYLNCNYRSSMHIVRFQNYLVKKMPVVLREDEQTEIIPMLKERQSQKPIWITDTPSNYQGILQILAELDDISVKILIADKIMAPKDKFPSDLLIEDMFACKGLEYPNVLLWNILTDMSEEDDRAENIWPWRYFYVGATRPRKRLVIFEKARSGKIIHFLEEAVQSGVLEKCDDLDGRKSDQSQTWKEWLIRWLSDIQDEDKLQAAENYEETEHFQQAAKIYQRFLKQGYGEEYYRCTAKWYLQQHDYDAVLDNLWHLDHQEDLQQDLLAIENLPAPVYLALALHQMNPDSIDAFDQVKLHLADRYGHDLDYHTLLPQIEKRHPEAIQQACQWERKQKLVIHALCQKIVKKAVQRGKINEGNI